MKGGKTKTIFVVCVAFLLVLSTVLAMPVAASEDAKGQSDDGASRTGVKSESRKMLDVGKTTITIDGDPSDWAGISPIVSDQSGDAASNFDILAVYVTDDGTNLYLRMDLAELARIGYVYFDLDVDENINTGYNTNTDIWDWYLNPHDTGVDYWVEVDMAYGDAVLYAVDSSGDTTYIGSVPVGIGSVVEVAVPLRAIGGATPSLNMDFQTYYYGPRDEAPDVGNVHYPAVEEPVVEIYTDATTYAPGDTMHVGLNIINSGSEQDVRFAVWLEKPDGNIVKVVFRPVTLPAYFNYSNPDFLVFTLPEWLEAGTYVWHSALLEPTGPIEFISNDTAEWVFTANVTNVSAGEKWAVIIGNVYAGTPFQLEYTDDDAYDMYNTLVNSGWQADHIQLLIDADKATIEAAINWLASNAGPNDTVLFFYSGHGTYIPDLPPIDEADGWDEAICPVGNTIITDDELDEMLDTINSNAIVVIIDSCFSGGLAKADLRAKTLPKSKVNIIDGFGKDIGEAGRVVLMACDEDEYSYETPTLQNGVFTYFIVEGLLGSADANANGLVSAEEAFDYADPLVLSYMNGLQDPQIYDGYPGEVNITIISKLIPQPSLDFQ